jgi:MoaA/NifB/PqqE/SkfB family radical SAM enzyme
MRRSRKLPLVDAPTLPRNASIRPQLGREELTITFGFHCNLACTFCLVEDALNVYGGVDLASVERLLADERVTNGVKTILLSGGEVTIEQDLERYVELCRAVPGVEHVRLQTNAVRLADDAYLARLLDVGVDQFFVSFHGATAATCDAITQRPGSFEQILAGMRNIAGSRGELMTNTVIVEANYRELPAIADLVLPLGPTRVDFWNYLPRVDRVDVRGQLTRVEEIAPHLVAALDRCEGRAPRVIVKHFPRCLLGRHGHLQDDSQPTSLVDDAFWGPYPPYGCLYEGVCVDAGQEACRGLPFAYVRRFGWEEDLLIPNLAGARQSGGGDYWSWARPAEGAPAPPGAPRSRALAALGLGEGGAIAGWAAARVKASADRVRVELARNGHQIAIDLSARDDQKPCFARSASLNLVYAKVSPEVLEAARPMLAELAARVRAADRGGAWGALSRELGAAPGVATATSPPRERPEAPADGAALAAVIEALPRGEHPGFDGGDPHAPGLQRFASRVFEAIGRGALRPDVVEPSIALDEPGLRFHVNTTAGGATCEQRERLTLDLIEAAGVSSPAFAPLVRGWLSKASHEVFVGVATAQRATRAKVYLRAQVDSRAALDAVVAGLGGVVPDDDAPIHMLCVDFDGSAPMAFKRYAAIDRHAAEREYGQGRLWSLLASRGASGREAPLYRCRRFDPAGRLVNESLHVQAERLAGPPVDLEYAAASPDALARLRALHAVAPLVVRALSETLGEGTRGRNVYLALRGPDARLSPKLPLRGRAES